MQVENLSAEELLVAGITGAMVVVFGGLYALFLALNLMYRRSRDRLIAYLSYFFLCLSLFALAQALHMSGMWRFVIALLMIGYLVSPHLIWKLTQATHNNIGASSHD